MATSGSTDWTATRNQIIRQAALDLKAISAGVTMSDEMLNDFAFRLNAMVKRWNAMGIHVWTVTEGVLFPQPGQARYNLGGASTPDHATQTFYQTSLSAAEASGQTILSVESTEDMAVDDQIGIVVDDGTIHWSTIDAKGASTVTIADALDDDAAAGNLVFNYTTAIVRPLKIVAARRYSTTDDHATDIRMVARGDYQRLANKTSTGTVNQAFYDPQLSAGYLNLWYAPLAVAEIIKFTWHRPIQDFDASSDNADLPQEWISTLISNLANEMKHQFSVTPQKSRELQQTANQLLIDVIGFDREEESIQMQPDLE